MPYPDDFKGVLPQDDIAPIEYPTNRYLDGEADDAGNRQALLDHHNFHRVLALIKDAETKALRLAQEGNRREVQELFAEFISTLRDDPFEIMLMEIEETLEAGE